MKPVFGLLDANDPSLPIGETDFGEFVLDKGQLHDSMILTDRYLLARPNCTKLYAWVQESPAILPEAYSEALRCAGDYDLVFTPMRGFDGDNFRYAPSGGCWIPTEDRFVHEKTEMVSIVASGKRYPNAPGHHLRHRVIDALHGTNLAVFGHGYTPVEFKTEAMASYRYAVVIENVRAMGYFSEKLIDALVLGCIPIYYGDPLIAEEFDTDGFIIANSVEEFVNAYSKCSNAHYDEMADIIERNRVTALTYASVHHNMWNAGLRDE